jgi:hypothetical protein
MNLNTVRNNIKKILQVNGISRHKIIKSTHQSIVVNSSCIKQNYYNAKLEIFLYIPNSENKTK